MKQLKVIEPSYTSTNGIFTASFKDSFTIDAESRIMFDKISFVVNAGNTTSFNTPNQVILLNNFANQRLSSDVQVLISGQTFNTLSDLMAVLNRAFAKTLISDPLYPTAGGLPSDAGLAYYNSIAGSASPYTYEFYFDQQQIEFDANGTLDNMVPIVHNGYDYFAPQDFDVPYSYTSGSILLKGGLSASTSIYNFSNINMNGFFEMGLYDQNVLSFGIRWIGGDNRMYYVVDGIEKNEITNTAAFVNPTPATPGKRCYFYVSEGQLRFALCDMTDADPQNWTKLIESPLGTFLGYDVNSDYVFNITGLKSVVTTALAFSHPLITQDRITKINNRGSYLDFTGIGSIRYLPKALPNPLPVYANWNPPDDNVFTRSIRLNFNGALTLLNGLGLGAPVLTTAAGYDGSIVSALAAGFVSNTELQLDVLELPLDSYISNRGGNSGRVNCITFFTPQLLNPVSLGNSQFVFENKNMPFINIKNVQPMVIESLSFRLFNPVTPTATIEFQNISFNMYIQSPKDGLQVALA